MFQYLSLAEPIGGAQTVCDRLPAAAALYAWFRGVEIPVATPEGSLSAIRGAIEARAAPDHHARLGHMHRVSLEARSQLPRSREEHLTELLVDEPFRHYLADLIGKAALLQAPLYVGKAQNLQRRIRQHLEPMSELSVRLRESDTEIRECVLAYTLMPDLKDFNDDKTLRLLEDIITRICRPGFVLRPG
jgi:hypothetical protein